MDEPERDIEQIPTEKPVDVKARTDLGLRHFASGRLEQALGEFRRALETVPKDPVASYNVAAVLCARDAPADALEVVETALEEAPENGILHYGRACALNLLGRPDDAIAAFQRALGRDASYANAWYGLGTAYQAKADEASAMYCFARASELDPDHAAARHMVNALAGSFARSPPSGFVRDLFDFYASSFDRHLLETLSYEAPEHLLAALRPLIGGREDLPVLDLGCGTGLFGARIRPYAARLIGIDVSPAMLVRARQKTIYDELREADIVDGLEAAPPGAYDLVTAADVFIYLGALDAVVAGSHRVLGAGGLLAFTVETDTGDGYSLSQTGRYRHSRAYLETLGAECGFEAVGLTSVTLRWEGGRPCPGFVVVLRKPA